MAAWFVWERDFSRRWTPAVYHLGRPKATEDRIVMGEAEPHEMGMDGTPIFGRLVERYPAPKDRVES